MEPVTVIVPVYNTPSIFLQPCLDSIKAQTLPCKVIIVDDHSKSYKYDYLKSYIKDKPSWQLIRHRRNRGVAWARNTALSRVTTPYTAICDSDDTWQPTKLETQVKALDLNEADVNICGVRLDYRNAADYPMKERTAPKSLFKEIEALQLLSNTQEKSRSEFILEAETIRTVYTKLIRFNASLCGSNSVFRTDALVSIGGFDETLNGADEWDALLSVASFGKVCISTETLVNYVRHSGSFSTTKLKHLRSVCEEIIYKHRKRLNDQERVLLQSVETARWATDFERLTFVPDTPYRIIQYQG